MTFALSFATFGILPANAAESSNSSESDCPFTFSSPQYPDAYFETDMIDTNKARITTNGENIFINGVSDAERNFMQEVIDDNQDLENDLIDGNGSIVGIVNYMVQQRGGTTSQWSICCWVNNLYY